MRRAVWIFFAAILLPSIGLAWLAVRSARDQQVILEHQQVIISQNITDTLAKSVQEQMDQILNDFVLVLQQQLEQNPSPQNLAENFHRKLLGTWPLAEIGFAVNLDGRIYSPLPSDGAAARTFRDQNDRFLSNRENAEVYFTANAVTQQSATGFAYRGTATGKGSQDIAKSSVLRKEAEVASDDKERNADELRESYAEKTKSREQSASVSAAVDSLSKNTKAIIAPPPANATGEMADAKSATGSAEVNAPTDAPATAVHSTATGADSVSTTSPPAASPVVTAPTPSAPAAPAAPKDAADAGKPTALPVAKAAARVAQAFTNSDSIQDADRRDATRAEASSEKKLLAGGSQNSEKQQQAQMLKSEWSSQAPDSNRSQRLVMPQQQLDVQKNVVLSNAVPAESDFRRLIGTEKNGLLARFLENKLQLMVWSRPSPSDSIVFGAQLNKSKLAQALQTIVDSAAQSSSLAHDSYTFSRQAAYCFAILDDTGHPVALSIPGFTTDWKRPFVATEIGDVLPHWEAALYFTDPQHITRSAKTLQLAIGLIVLVLISAIVAGGALIAADVRRQMQLAQQKTDFVSNVSHELKTPLTSIRMFADLLADGRVEDPERQQSYLRIITAESARLTRLINNVLDFARLERGSPSGEHRPCDLVEVARDAIETCGPHLEAAGISFTAEIETASLPVLGDRDALSQIVLNLLSNAEKYGGGEIILRVRQQSTSSGEFACVDILDRGPGIPPKQAKAIFEPFHRLDDSLSSGIPGSGLGLTLARQFARAHHGDVHYSARAEGGSCFTLTIPLENKTSLS